MAFDRASANYIPTSADTKTVKTLLREIAGDTGVTHLATFNHCAAYDMVFDIEDSLIDVFTPKDGFRILYNGSRLNAFKQLLTYTKCVARIEDDGKIHIFQPTTSFTAPATPTTWTAITGYQLGDTVVPTTPNGWEYVCTNAGASHPTVEPTWPTIAGVTVVDNTVIWTTSYDYEYELAVSGEHTFFSKTLRKRLVTPNYIVVSSHPDYGDGYTGFTEDTDSSDSLEIREFHWVRAASNAQCVLIAAALLSHYQLEGQQGSATVPMNIGQEVHDAVRVTDSRENDSRVGNISYLWEHYTPDKYEMTFRLGRGKMTLLNDPEVQVSNEPEYNQVVSQGVIDSEVTLVKLDTGLAHSAAIISDNTKVTEMTDAYVLKKTFTVIKGTTHTRLKIATNLWQDEGSSSDYVRIDIRVNDVSKAEYLTVSKTAVEYTDYIDISGEAVGDMTIKIYIKVDSIGSPAGVAAHQFVEGFIGVGYT